ncbi:phosphatidylglycerophosphatase A [Arsenophonus nasoniae]|uniref:Phosphatidylglycerophosphatase A n=1 Tax=Arsenophonus nasoniae TaxID=638 RepID=D2TWA6_9GAMM|nr:phosphatidylglycerophosphatase A [Arsenophonus nasoniae]QBY44906.1 Phosphatidylglycerophosphatase A [Arsenophonus nasoniae]WGL94601.1 phosphatidylglycerophosphatase A [Arsenophonus nasoniae]WGM01059.1 phosphatidylglycerophosphatase A [Arsenophonus nasoniae]WGM05145.1 phosphatidylglycerophosphatase A [Arsenophonus nasoniae]WGM10157.1 phosphatidylglycerophosphatase A [Arsenophonus nasoniae]
MTDAKSRLNLSNPWHLLATGFGSGLSPIIPGTMGSLAAIPFWLLMYWLLPVWLCWLIILLGFAVGIVICQRTSDDMQVHDHGSIVWDEFIGMWMTLMAIPLVNWQWVLIAFVLFRFFDMLKPWPIGWFDRQVGGGFGIMLDDIIAAIFAIAIVAALAHWLPAL